MYNIINEGCCAPAPNMLSKPDPAMYELLNMLVDLSMDALGRANTIHNNLFGPVKCDAIEAKREVNCARDQISMIIDRMKEINKTLESITVQL